MIGQKGHCCDKGIHSARSLYVSSSASGIPVRYPISQTANFQHETNRAFVPVPGFELRLIVSTLAVFNKSE